MRLSTVARQRGRLSPTVSTLDVRPFAVECEYSGGMGGVWSDAESVSSSHSQHRPSQLPPYR